MPSNANVNLIIDNFDKEIYNYKILSCKRSINSKNQGSTT